MEIKPGPLLSQINSPDDLKKFKEEDDDDVIRKNTLREVKMLRSLKQENIVTLIEAFKK